MDNQLTYGIIKYCAEYVDIKKKKKKIRPRQHPYS